MSPTHTKGTQTPRQVNSTPIKRGAQSFPYTKNQPQGFYLRAPWRVYACKPVNGVCLL